MVLQHRVREVRTRREERGGVRGARAASAVSILGVVQERDRCSVLGKEGGGDLCGPVVPVYKERLLDDHAPVDGQAHSEQLRSEPAMPWTHR